MQEEEIKSQGMVFMINRNAEARSAQSISLSGY